MNKTSATVAAQWWAEQLESYSLPDHFVDQLTQLILQLPPTPWGDFECDSGLVAQLVPDLASQVDNWMQRVNSRIVVVSQRWGNKTNFLDPNGYLAAIDPGLDPDKLLDILLARVRDPEISLDKRLDYCRILGAMRLSYSLDRKVLIDLMQNPTELNVLRYAAAQALLGGCYATYEWAIPAIVETMNALEPSSWLGWQFRQLVAAMLLYPDRDGTSTIGQVTLGVVFKRDENDVWLSLRLEKYSYDQVPGWLASHDTFVAHVFYAGGEMMVADAFKPTTQDRNYVFVCKYEPVDRLHLAIDLPWTEADRLALEHAEMLAQQHMEPVYVMHVGAPTSREVGTRGQEYRERDKIEDVVGVVYRVEGNKSLLRIGGYNQLIALADGPDWLRVAGTIFTATARYDPQRTSLIRLRYYQPVEVLKRGQRLIYELGDRQVTIPYSDDIALADRQAIAQARQIRQAGAITITHCIGELRRLLAVVQNRQEYPLLNNRIHPMNYIAGYDDLPLEE